MSQKHAITRVRHEAKRRALTVTAAERLTPNMVRVRLAGDELEGFTSAGYDDHIKLFFPAAGPARGARRAAEGEPPPMRDYTPRRYDAKTGELTIDFALHDAGPATDWAAGAKPGDALAIGGPRGSFVVTDDFDWYLLVGDETALPAIGRRLEELRSQARVIVVAAVEGPDEEQALTSRAKLEVHWVHRPLNRASDPTPLLSAVKGLDLPAGDGYVWIAGESATSKAVRQHLVDARNHNRAWIKAAGYWRAGAAGVHDKHGDDDA